MVMEQGTSDDDGTCTSSDDEMERIVLHVYDDESKEFSSLTTYHGMIRIYSSETWPSRIFWSLVVVTCLTLFMMHSGSVLLGYHSHPTFFKTTDSLLMEEHLPAVTICRIGGADQWRHYHEIRSRNEFVSAFDAVLLGESLDARGLMDLHRLEDVFVNITRARFNIRRFLEESRTSCHDFVKSVWLADRQIKNHCEQAKWSLTDLGYCTTFSLWNTSIQHSMRIDVVSRSDGENVAVRLTSWIVSTRFITNSSAEEDFLLLQEAIIFHVHRRNGAIAIKSSGWRVPRGKTAKLSIQPRKKVLLESENWGDCTKGDRSMVTFYERTACERNCVIEEIMKRCACAPFFAEAPYMRACGLVEMYRCSRQDKQWRRCQCPIECEKVDFSKAVITYLKKKQKEHTTIEVSLRSRRLQTDEQLKRIKAVDLLSYVAGSMGLFLGMSCVTLLEIFIYIFKSVWGVFSDQRHKSYYLDNFLGDDGLENDDVPDEEIVITTKMRSSKIADETENNGLLIEHMDSSSTTIAPTSRQSAAFVPANQEHSSLVHYDHHHSRMKIQIVHHPFQRRKSSFAI